MDTNPDTAVAAEASDAPPDGAMEISAAEYEADIFEVKSIGSGSFGCAILVESRSTSNRFVAKKISLEALTAEERVKAQSEATLLRSFRHQNITEYLGSFVIGNVLHIVMEYCSGGSLQQAMARRERANETFDEEEVFDWFLQARAAAQPSSQPAPRAAACGSLARPVPRTLPLRCWCGGSRGLRLLSSCADWDGARVCACEARAAPRHQAEQRLPHQAQPRQAR